MRDTADVHAAFGTVLVVVCAVAAVVAVALLLRSAGTWSGYRDSAMVKDSEPPAAGPSTVATGEVRELLQARNHRRIRRGEPVVDVEAEVARLTGAGHGQAADDPGRSGAPPDRVAGRIDPELRTEIRDLVVARNHRRVRSGRPPLDIEAEIERELRRLEDL